MSVIELDLSNEDMNNIVNVLERYISELSSEIADTDNMDFREKLKAERNSLQLVLKQLKVKIPG